MNQHTLQRQHRKHVPAPPTDRLQGPAWLHEVLIAVLFYGVYTLTRDLQGSATVSYARALTNATRVIGLERRLGLFHERAVQSVLLGQRWLVVAANYFYGSLHMVVTVAVLVFLFRRHRACYRRARNALAVTTAVALIGFAVYPTLPPRLLPAQYGFVDTLARFGTPWSFDSGAVASVSNQYAAMPSLHFAWALWCAVSLAAVVRPRSVRLAVFAYPAITLGVIIVTANHFILDAVFGTAALALAMAVTGHHRPTFTDTADDRVTPA